MIATRHLRPRLSDPLPLIHLERGDVLQRGDQIGVLAGWAPQRVLIWQVRWQTAERTADIPVTSWHDNALLGNARQTIVQAGELVNVPRAGQRRLGQVTASLLTQIDNAALRSLETTRIVHRWQGERDHRRNSFAGSAKVF